MKRKMTKKRAREKELQVTIVPLYEIALDVL